MSIIAINKIVPKIIVVISLLFSCKQDTCIKSNSNDPLGITLWFTLNDRISGNDLFFGDNPSYKSDSISFEFNFGNNDYIFPVEDQYFLLSGLYYNEKEDYSFNVIYEDTPLGSLKIRYKRSLENDCDNDKNIMRGLQMIFNGELICSDCSRNTIYQILI